MTLQVAVVGIDGSGKSTLVRALPMVLAAELNVVAGAAGEDFYVFGPDQDHMAPGFHPNGLPLAARMSRACRAVAKRLANNPGVYPYFKLADLMFQDDATVSIARRHRCDVMISDCNLVLSAMGRASNYRRGATRKGAIRTRSTIEDLKAVFAYLVDGRALPEQSEGRLPSLGAAGLVSGMARLVGFDGLWVPDVVLFLDIQPAAAMMRLRSRAGRLDGHENEADMTRARDTYIKALKALDDYTGRPCTHIIDVTDAEPREVLSLAVAALRPHLAEHRSTAGRSVLGTTGTGTARSVLNPRYLVRYLLGRFFHGAWREPLFLLSPMGRQLLREGYSAGVMRVIYDQHDSGHGPLDRVFLDYPLHRAVYDRLQILTGVIETELRERLERQPAVRIFTAPSGFCYDLFRPLESIAATRPELMRKVEIVAADLDPHGILAAELAARAQRLGIGFRFVVRDITADDTQRELSHLGPYDLALFVGLSSWLPKPQALRHLRWLASNLDTDGVLVSDCFTAAAYSLGGRYIGYRAQYYTPAEYRSLVDYCGFDGRSATIDSGRDGINHVLVTWPAYEPVRTWS